MTDIFETVPAGAIDLSNIYDAIFSAKIVTKMFDRVLNTSLQSSLQLSPTYCINFYEPMETVLGI